MKTEHYNELTEKEQELLACLAEECAEVVQAVMKVIRHGWHPGVYLEATNKEDIENECGDVRRAMIELCRAGILSKQNIHTRAELHDPRKEKFFHHQGIQGNPDLDDGA